ncbi:glycoside hydrolase [Chryseolinea sp. H1M3-3]|uniref:glycoside hydrolase n=1 Tax=Chryseolinea sp. H1M3-3 TaxID=3034144 RepID=UPI0023EBEE35|nr:glycoside hydrolase [Chryseolinea sp. H1M3-3]
MKHFPLAGRTLFSLFFSLALLAGCSKNSSLEAYEDDTQNTIVIDLADKKQIIRNFGASDAWACQYIGQWPDAKRKQVADWLFSMEVDDLGKPKGIGLSLWRFNIGAGSATQNNISDDWRKTEGFLQDDMSYDWTKQAGQKWFMHAAKQRGVKQFLGFTNSPPIQLTKNGKAYSSNGEEANIPVGNYLPFSKFLVEVAKQFHKEEIPFNYLSPFNEPQWDWTGNGQEGSPFTNAEIFAITKDLDSLLTAVQLDIKIQIAEAGKLNYLYETADKPTRGNQVYEFFNEQSPLFLGDLSNVDKTITGHSYFTAAPAETLKRVRMKVSETVQTATVPLEFWQSEYCILGDEEEVKGPGKDTGITPALYVARLIHHDLVFANASAWHWWLSVSVYDYKDGLIYAEKYKTEGEIEDSKLLWAFGNFSRFIRPGAQRIAVTAANMDLDNVSQLMISSYLDANNQTLITVIINNGNSDSSVAIHTKGGEIKSWQPYVTGPNEDERLKPLPKSNADNIVIPKKSILTLVGELK